MTTRLSCERETEMKLVTAIVRSERLDEIIDAVIDNGGRGLTATTVRGFGQQFGERGQRAVEADTDATLGLPLSRRAVLLSKVRLDILVLDEDAQAMADAIAKHARTGAIGDGKVWVSSVDSVLRVRTGELDRDAV
jgi:nitrogen regulatory protein P-II 1